jgi:hypothetical protein
MTLSALLVTGVTLIALVLGWLIMNSVVSRTIPIGQNGVTASVPSGWMVKYGLQNEEMVFSTSDQLDPHHRYAVYLRPAVPGGSVTDVAAPRILEYGLNGSGYQLLDQSPAQVNGVEGYRVEFAYIRTGGPGLAPVVIRGVDYYVPQGQKVLIISMENESSHFASGVEAFSNFLVSVRFKTGG